MNVKDTSKFIDYKKTGQAIKETHRLKKEKAINEYLLNPTKCTYCDSILPFERRNAKYCNVSCANKNRKHSEETKQKISSSVKTFIKENPEEFYKYLEHENQRNNKRFSSKNEKELLGIVKNRFSSFTSGGRFKLDEQTFLPLDMYSKEIQLIIEYDGIYHFKDIYGNFEKVKERDSKLNNWCINNNWKIIRINELTYLKHKEKIIETLMAMINEVEKLEPINLLYWEQEF